MQVAIENIESEIAELLLYEKELIKKFLAQEKNKSPYLRNSLFKKIQENYRKIKSLKIINP